jgi:hypothetical protein
MHDVTRFWSISLALFTLVILCPSTAGAAGSYSEDFDDNQAQNWSTVNNTFTATGGYYKNNEGGFETILSVYDGDTWNTDFTYSASLYTVHGATGNRVGIVFNYQDSSNFYELLFNATGGVFLNKVIAGTRTLVQGGTFPAPGNGTWFDVEIVRSGPNTSITASGLHVLTVAQTELGAGKIGVACRFNTCRYDDVAVAPNAATYSENFDDNQAQNWSTVNNTFTAVDGYYRNNEGGFETILSVYDGATWNTDFTYNASLYTVHGATGNRVGVVFNYQDSSNFYELLFNATGDVFLNKVIGGTRTLVQGDTFPAPGNGTWFDVEVVRSGSNTSVTANGQHVLTVAQTELGAGKIGVACRFNTCRYDDVSVTGGGSLPPAPAALFRSGFESGVNLVGPTCNSGAWFMDMGGTDSATGHTWMPTMWGPPATTAFNTAIACTATFTDYLVLQLKNVTGPTGTTTRVLSDHLQSLEQTRPSGIPRGGISYHPESEQSTMPNRVYIRRWLKFSSNLATGWGNHDWFVQHEYKGQDCELPRRLLVYWRTDGNAVPFYSLTLDSANNCGAPNEFTPIWEERCYPTQGGNCPAFPTGQWFYDEYFVQHSASGTAQDRVAYAINGQVIFDRQAPVVTPTPRFHKLTPGYLNIPNIEIQTDDLEVHADIPCAEFPCGPPQHN